MNPAESVLDNIQLYNDELRQFYALMKMRIDLAQDDGKTFLDVDGSQVEDLWGIAGTETRAAIQAQNILRLALDTSFAELIEEIDTSSGGSKWGMEEKMITEEKVKEENPTEPAFGNLYPNPTKDGFIIEYYLPENMDDVQLEIFDLIGNKIINEKLKSDKLKAEVNTSKLNSKIYLCRIKSGKETLSTQKLVIIQ